jgi:hypothetical protein
MYTLFFVFLGSSAALWGDGLSRWGHVVLALSVRFVGVAVCSSPL